MNNRQAQLISRMKDREVLFHLYITQLLLLIAAGISAFFLFKDVETFKSVWEVDLPEVLIYGGGSAFIVIVIDLVLMKFLPKSLLDDGGINEKVFRKRTIPHIFLLAAVIAFSEELLFRGIVQTNFGIVIASIVFALLHYRYLLKWVLLLAVVLLSFLLGVLYELTENLWVTIFSHFLIDAVFAIKIRIDYLKDGSNKSY